jgi:hypothetical protein
MMTHISFILGRVPSIDFTSKILLKWLMIFDDTAWGWSWRYCAACCQECFASRRPDSLLGEMMGMPLYSHWYCGAQNATWMLSSKVPA